jgi:hypothetical protein
VLNRTGSGARISRSPPSGECQVRALRRFSKWPKMSWRAPRPAWTSGDKKDYQKPVRGDRLHTARTQHDRRHAVIRCGSSHGVSGHQEHPCVGALRSDCRGCDVGGTTRGHRGIAPAEASLGDQLSPSGGPASCNGSDPSTLIVNARRRSHRLTRDALQRSKKPMVQIQLWPKMV